MAQQYKYLDIDLVYKCKWRNSGITVHSINTVLVNIKDKLWSINECVQTVPISYDACRAIIEFGLKEANLRLLYELGDETKSDVKQPLLSNDISDEEIKGLIDFENLNDQQKELQQCCEDLSRYRISLLAYGSILGPTVQQAFDHVFYDEFRQKSPLTAVIDYAHEGDAHAIDILLDLYGDLKSHRLDILSNFPETLSPYQYRNLLPCLREGKVDSALTKWFIERALEMESRTLLLTNAIQLIRLGIDLNIQDLQTTQDDLIEFDRIVYDCCTEANIYLSFSEFNQMAELDRIILMTGDSQKSCRDRFRFYVIPYISRRETQLGFQGKVDLLREYFTKLAQCKEHICELIYKDLLDRIESDDYVAEWTKDLDDILDEIGDEIKTIKRDRQAKQLSAMASQTMALGDYNECYEACQLIMKKDHKECWALCCQLGMHKQFNNAEAKYKLLAFALAHCDDPDGKMSAKILDYIVELRKRDEKLQLAYLQLNL